MAVITAHARPLKFPKQIIYSHGSLSCLPLVHTMSWLWNHHDMANTRYSSEPAQNIANPPWESLKGNVSLAAWTSLASPKDTWSLLLMSHIRFNSWLFTLPKVILNSFFPLASWLAYSVDNYMSYSFWVILMGTSKFTNSLCCLGTQKWWLVTWNFLSACLRPAYMLRREQVWT